MLRNAEDFRCRSGALKATAKCGFAVSLAKRTRVSSSHFCGLQLSRLGNQKEIYDFCGTVAQSKIVLRIQEQQIVEKLTKIQTIFVTI